MGVLAGFRSRQLEKYIRKEKSKQNHVKETITLNEIVSIGILLDGKQQHMVDYVEQYGASLINEEKSVSILAYTSKVNKEVNLDIPFFTKEDVNWYCKPSEKHVMDFMQKPFDLLLNFSPNKILPLECICALSKANYVVGNGMDHFTYYYDFLLKLNNSNAPESFVENVHHYLNLQR